jgi:DNA-binding NarL/FixJ family response regulator
LQYLLCVASLQDKPSPVHKILIADDSELIREFLKGLAGQYKDWTIVGEAVNGRQAVLMAASLNPDLVVLDLAMPMLDGIHAAAEILKVSPSMPVILYTLHDMPHLLLEAKKVGIREVVFKTSDATELADAIHRVLKDAASTSAPGTVTAPPLFVEGDKASAPSQPDHGASESPTPDAAASKPEESTGAN